jgi:1,4-dihydroxy-2-naphthoyl-CoA hydrolase
LNKKEVLNKIAQFQKNTMTDRIGIEITDFCEQCISGKMPVDKRTKQPFGLLHGGASAVFAESLGSIGGGMCVDLKKKSVVGIELNVSHLKSVTSGWVYGLATAVRVGSKIQVWEIDITDENKTMVCKGRLTLAVINKK